MKMRNYSTLHFETDIALLYSTITVAVGYSAMSKICTRIRKSRKDKKHNDQKKRIKGQTTWLSTTEYLCQKWPRICSTCRKHLPVPSSFMTYHLVCSYIKMTDVTTGAGTAYPLRAPELIPGL
jgi:hypothetical protein